MDCSLESLIESEVQCLSCWVKRKINSVTFPENHQAFVGYHSLKTMNKASKTSVSLIKKCLKDRSILNRLTHFDDLNGRNDGLGDRGSSTTNDKILDEIKERSLFFSTFVRSHSSFYYFRILFVRVINCWNFLSPLCYMLILPLPDLDFTGCFLLIPLIIYLTRISINTFTNLPKVYPQNLVNFY